MSKESYTILSSSGTKLFCESRLTEVSPKAVLCIVHGLGEHLGRYDVLAKTFLDNQMAVFSFDHRGHGKSEGKTSGGYSFL